MKTLLALILFTSLALGQVDSAPVMSVSKGFDTVFVTKYEFRIDTLRYPMILWRDNFGLVHADSAYQIRAGMVRVSSFGIDNRAKWLFLYNGKLINESDVLTWYWRW